MKVVLFCGGLGTRLREHSDTIPKPLVNIGHRPILWHLMRYYAHFGHKDFVLCLGYRGDLIREYFLTYRDELTNDFVLHPGSGKVELLTRDAADWRITFVDTGMHSNIGQRLLRVRRFVDQEPMFLANYADGLSDLPLDNLIDLVRAKNALAGFAAIRSSQSFHSVRAAPDGIVTAMGTMNQADLWINGGFFALRREIFDFLSEGEELVEKPFERLIEQRRLVSYQHEGFWQSMDTFKDKITFDRMEAKGNCPWMLWRK
ncbi:MAG TPA: sugar phosphate nucleotidyltransferase [Terriglobales bacterium]|nr:sugar phosphate nucleotidyltransferase [Terriglobales bacterium]